MGIRWVYAHSVVLFSVSVPLFVTCSAAELTYSEMVKETTQGIEKDMEIYAGPPTIPQPDVALRSPEMLKWSGDVREARLGALERMDRAVIDMIEDGFKRGLGLDSIRSRTESCVTWLEWPSSYDNRHGEPLGFRDWNLEDDEWQRLANSVKVIHQTYKASNGADFHFFQNTFRSLSNKRYVRPSFSAYVVILENGALRREKLFWSLASELLESYPPKLIGFVKQLDNAFPGILMYTGPGGTAHVIELYYYSWDDTLNRWQERHLKSIDSAHSLVFNPETGVLSTYVNPEIVTSTMNVLDIVTLGPESMKK